MFPASMFAGRWCMLKAERVIAVACGMAPAPFFPGRLRVKTMPLHPTRAVWFEVWTPRDQTVRATEVLAASGVVQLELEARPDEWVDSGRLRFFVERFEALAAEHAAELPAAVARPTALLGNSVHIANQALHRLRVWRARFDYLREHLAQLRAEHDQLALLTECLTGMRAAGLDLDGVFRQTRFLCKCLFACPRAAAGGAPNLPADLANVVRRLSHGAGHDFLYFVGTPEQRDAIARLVVEGGCEQIGVPGWLAGGPAQQGSLLLAHLTGIAREIARLESELRVLRHDDGMAEARANIETLGWYLRNAAADTDQHSMCHITGWTTGRDPHDLRRRLDAAGIKALVRFPQPPARAVAPVALLDAWWARPFQPLLQMWGTPDSTQVDPSGLLAIVVPLLFGYMFPDVGHGLVLVLFAALFSRRWPRIAFLLPCGVSAMGFGLLFGEVFGFEHLLAPLWLKPLEDPLPVLAVPLLFGAGLMLLGLVFAGIEAAWRGRLREWLLVDAAVLIMYAATLVGLFAPVAFWLAALALPLYFIGNLVLAQESRLKALLAALGELLLSTFELVMNTFSFVRVGAFALAHAALSMAIMTLAHGFEHPLAFALALLLGNLLSIVLETLLVYVQTTRLVLFEFFIRFLSEEGRLFRPARRPPGAAMVDNRKANHQELRG